VALHKVKAGMKWGMIAALWLSVAPAAAAPARPEPAPSRETAAPAAPRPAIWLLSDADTNIYLFGTIHILPPELQWRSAELNRVVAEADELVMETADDREGRRDEALLPLMMLGKSVPLADRVSPERRDGLRRMIAESGMPSAAFDGMQTWAAAMTLAVVAISQQYAGDDVSPDELTGVEDALRADFEGRNRPISGVETSHGQLSIFARMPLRTQRAMLESMIDSFESGDADIMDPGEDGWVRGDVTRMAAEMEEMPPEMFEALLVRRNQAWTDWLIARLDRPGTILFAVGAGHLAGRASVQSMLEARGFTVRRVN
jgi:uncharacterized protein YbaP (TraB family)